MTTLVAAPRNTIISDATNNPVDPTEAFKITVSDITKSLPFLNTLISFESVTVLLQIEYLKQELIDADTTYKSAAAHPNKALLVEINVLPKILTSQFQNHQTHPSTDLNINPALKAQDTIKTHYF